MTDSSLREIGERVFKRLGFHPTDLLYQRLGRVISARMRQRGLDSQDAYLACLGREGDGEWDLLSEALTINETYFFREPKHFEAVTALLPAFARSSDPVRILSAGCATGEEAYSLAIVACRALSSPRPHVEIVGVDIDGLALHKAREGLYDPWSFREDALTLAQSYVRPEGAKLRVRPQLRQLVRFEQMNLTSQRPTGPFHIIICRNILMYLTTDHRNAVLSHLVELLPPGGALFTSSTEVLHDLPHELERIFAHGAHFYRRRAAAAVSAAIRVALVSRSPIFRKAVRDILRNDAEITIVSEGQRYPAPESRSEDPGMDLVVLDGALYGINGALQPSDARNPVRVLVVAGPADDAVPAPGVEVAAMPDADPAALKDHGAMLVRRIRWAARRPPPRTEAAPRALSGLRPDRIVIVGSSTGGPAAVTTVLQGLPSGLGLAILIVQHMPAGFTASFADRLDRVTPFRVSEAADGMHLQPGAAYVAPGQRNTLVGPGGVLKVAAPEPGDIYVPNINRSFQSVADAGLAGRTLAVVLTGMGTDGAEGLAALAEAGARTLVQEPTEAVIPGMVNAAIQRGAAQHIAKLADIVKEIARWAGRASGAGPTTKREVR